jgi:cysteinyl-tRNA synthetase
LGLLQEDPDTYLQAFPEQSGAGHAIREEIERLISERNQARKIRDWATADRIRAELKAQGIVLEDSPQGTTWRREN